MFFAVVAAKEDNCQKKQANNYNKSIDKLEFQNEARQILIDAEKELGWMFETIHYIKNKPAISKGKINYVIWSDVWSCPYCNEKYAYWDLAINIENGKELKSYYCKNCNSLITKNESKRVFRTYFDNELKESFEGGTREYEADYSAGIITKNPLGLANALRKIESFVLANPIRGNSATSHLFIVNPFKADAISKLFSTHPKTEDRIKRLEELAKKI